MVKQLDQSHLSAILQLLKENSLPVKDIDLKKQSFWGLVKQDQLIGIGALEIKGDSALLRSLAIDKKSQNMGLGNQLLTTMLELSRSKGIKNLFLLTETAESFFKKNNFKNINRNQVPEEIAMTEEFKFICPSTAICMTLKIES